MTKIDVSDIRIFVNKLLENPRINQKDKEAYCYLLEHFLMEAKEYNGFRYLYWSKQGFEEWKKAGEPGFPEKNKYIGPEYDRTYY
ncbi:hypothetical protein METP3_02234 [Methanosarcinales archaeon]|nr:hypothetical protein METP3_02234 [Methanosarcinales archaeon]